MKTRSILVYFPGYPFSEQALMPRQRLAALAGSLLEAGHSTAIRDYGTIELVERVFPPSCSDTSRRIHDQLERGGLNNPLHAIGAMWPLKHGDKLFRSRRAEASTEVGRNLAGQRGLDFITFELDDREELEAAAQMAAVVRRDAPGIKLAAIGALVSQYPGAVAAFCPDLDCLCVGDAEHGLVQWAERLERRDAWDRIPNLVYRHGKTVRRTALSHVVDLRTVAEPAYEPDVYGALEGNNKLKLFTVEDSRGCGCRCNGCPNASSAWCRLRIKPTAILRDELSRLDVLYGARAFHFSGAGAPASHALALSREIESRGLDIVYSRTAHAGYSNPAAFAALYHSGCRAVGFQVDSGSQRLLDDFYGNGLQVSKVERVLRAARDAGLFTLTRLTYPAPDEDYHTLAETLRLLDRVKPHASEALLPEVAENSRWFKHAKGFGFSFDDPGQAVKALPGRAAFPLPANRWRLPARAIGGFSASQAVRSLETLLFEIKSRRIGTRASELSAVVAHLLGRSGEEDSFTTGIQRSLLIGQASEVAAVVEYFNEAACVPLTSARFTPLAGLRTAVGD